MTQQYISMNRGQALKDILVATAAPTADVFVQILTTHSPTKEDVILSLEYIKQYILSNGLPTGETGVDLPVL